MISIFFQELFLFAAVQLIGVFVVLRAMGSATGTVQNIEFDLSVGEIFFLLAFFTVLVYLLVRFSRRSGLFFRAVLAIAIFAGSQTVFAAIFQNYLFSVLAAFFLAFFASKIKIVFLHNFAVVLALAGVGAILGLSLSPIAAVIILTVLSFYDIVAVYKTKHMVAIAEEMIKSRAISGIILSKNLKSWKADLENVRPGGEFMILGSGDLIMPLILIASVIGLHGIKSGLVVFIFSVIGLFLTYYLFIAQKSRRPMAALPPIAALSIIGYLVSLVL